MCVPSHPATKSASRAGRCTRDLGVTCFPRFAPEPSIGISNLKKCLKKGLKNCVTATTTNILVHNINIQSNMLWAIDIGEI